MDHLMEDVQLVIFSYLCPKEIYSLYHSCDYFKTIIDELVRHPGFQIQDCKSIVDDEVVLWFQEMHIYLKLMEITIEIDDRILWFKNGKLHRDDDLPAVLWLDGTRAWYQNGETHRDNDKPAFINPWGDQHWYQNGLRHRENDLPASIYVYGQTIWYFNGQKHRENNLPAVIYFNGDKEWWYHDKRINSKSYRRILGCFFR